MTSSEIISICYDSIKKNQYIHIPDELLFSLENEHIDAIINEFSGHQMIKLPTPEIDFFEWLKTIDLDVWNDLWLDEESPFEKYLISIDLLPLLLSKDGRGFPICDLINNDNYYFTEHQMVDEESKIVIETARELFRQNKNLTIAQLLALEISINPIDIWHFAYKHKIELNDAKKAVEVLVADNALVHLTKAEHIANFINF